MALDRALTSIQGITEPRDVQLLVQSLASASTELAAEAASIPVALESLDARKHSLGYLHLLSHFVNKPEPTPEEKESAVSITARFLTDFLPDQILEHQDSFALLIHLTRSFTNACVESGNAKAGVLPILETLRKVQPSADYLTPMHAQLAQLCLLSRTHCIALPVLMEDVFEVDPAKTGLTATDFQLYCYYGGTLVAAMDNHRRALDLFMHGLTAPAIAPSAITLAIYKKFILVSLIATGAAPTRLPRYTPMPVTRLVKAQAAQYGQLAVAAAPGAPPDKLAQLLDEHASTFAGDGNAGLANQLAARASRRCIQRLTQTYITLSLSDIASQAGLPSAAAAEMTVLRMIGAGEIHARIDDQDGMVKFSEGPADFSSARCMDALSARVQECVALAARMRSMNDAVSTDPAYINKVELRAARFRGSGDPSGPHPMAPGLHGAGAIEAALPSGLQ